MCACSTMHISVSGAALVLTGGQIGVKKVAFSNLCGLVRTERRRFQIYLK